MLKATVHSIHKVVPFQLVSFVSSLMLTLKHLLFDHCAQKADKSWYPGRATIAIHRYLYTKYLKSCVLILVLLATNVIIAKISTR